VYSGCRPTARNASDDAAAEVLGYVAGVTLRKAAPIDARSWVSRNIESGGQYFANGAEARLYGTKGDRTLEIVARAASPESRTSGITERITSQGGITSRPPR
jgi:hypothetical protein